jgi:hypothetical protein
VLLAPATPSDITISLTDAHVGMLVDTEARWPKTLHLDGFTYDAIQAYPEVNAKARLRWLELHPGGYTPQPYEQLIAAYRRVGHDQAARTVAIAKQRRRRTELNWPGKVWNTLLAWTVGYGYRTWQALLWLAAFLLAGWVILAAAYPTHLTPAKRPSESAPSFHPAMYSLDTLLPVGGLASAGLLDSPRHSPMVGLGIDPGRLGADHGRRCRPDRYSQERLTRRAGGDY